MLIQSFAMPADVPYQWRLSGYCLWCSQVWQKSGRYRKGDLDHGRQEEKMYLLEVVTRREKHTYGYDI